MALLAQYYYLTRSKTEQDASLYAMQQQGYGDEQVNKAKAQIADLLTAMNTRPWRATTSSSRCPSRCSTCPTSSTPACRGGAATPGASCRNGTTRTTATSGHASMPPTRAIGQLRLPNLLRPRQPVLLRYHNVANTVYVNHSVKLAKRHAKWLRHQDDWRSVVAHDRLQHQSPTVRRASPARLPAGNLGGYALGTRNLAAHTVQSHTTRRSATRSPSNTTTSPKGTMPRRHACRSRSTRQPRRTLPMLRLLARPNSIREPSPMRTTPQLRIPMRLTPGMPRGTRYIRILSMLPERTPGMHGTSKWTVHQGGEVQAAAWVRRLPVRSRRPVVPGVSCAFSGLAAVYSPPNSSSHTASMVAW